MLHTKFSKWVKVPDVHLKSSRECTYSLISSAVYLFRLGSQRTFEVILTHRHCFEKIIPAARYHVKRYYQKNNTIDPLSYFEVLRTAILQPQQSLQYPLTVLR